MGRDYEAECIDYKTSKFQPTRPYGARHLALIHGVSFGFWFQPTRPYGARLAVYAG